MAKSGERVALAMVPVGMAFVCEEGIESVRTDAMTLGCYKVENLNPAVDGKTYRWVSQGREVTIL